MLKDLQKKKLIELLNEVATKYDCPDSETVAEYLIDKGVEVPLAAVGDEIYVIMVKKAPGEGRYNRGFMATSPMHLALDAEFEIVKKVCVKSDIQYMGRLAFTTREEAEEALVRARGGRRECLNGFQ